MREIIHTTKAPEPIGPYSQAIKVGNTVYVSGQICINPESGQLTNANVLEETKQVLENLKAVVEAAGMDLKDVVKCSIFLSNMNLFARVNEVYSEYFNSIQPARETVEVSCLPKEVNVEISCIAVSD